jgi:hypothetical protein
MKSMLIALINTNRKPQSSVTLNVNPTLFVIPYKFLGVLYTYSVVITITYQLTFQSNFQLSMTIFHHKLLIREGRVLANG